MSASARGFEDIEAPVLQHRDGQVTVTSTGLRTLLGVATIAPGRSIASMATADERARIREWLAAPSAAVATRLRAADGTAVAVYMLAVSDVVVVWPRRATLDVGADAGHKEAAKADGYSEANPGAADAAGTTASASQARAVVDPGDELDRTAELERLREMNEFKTNLLNMAAHELNTPLTPLRLQTHMLKSGTLGALEPRQDRAISILDRNVERLGDLVADILDVARMHSGRLKLNAKPVSILDLVRDAYEAYQEAAARVGVDIRFCESEDLVVSADPRRLLQVLYNLISNAVKFTPEGGHINVECREEDGYAILRVEDSGIGLDEGQIDRLFQPFSQVHNTNAITQPGTGLGLHICKGIIEEHSGKIGVHSDGPGRGSTFHFTVPISEIPTADVESPPVPSAPQARQSDPIAKRLRELM